MAEEPKVKIVDKDEQKRQALMEAETKRFLDISSKIVDLLIEGEFTIIEWNRVSQTVNGRINKKIDDAHIKNLMELK